MKFVPTTVLLALAALVSPLRAQVQPVQFDWFEYKGLGSEPAEIPTGQYRNPILSGFYPDPSICRVGDDYYLINSTFAYFPGIPVFHSRDLVNWKQLGHVIDRPDQLPYDKLGVSRGIFAPAISHHDGVFYVICTQVDAGGNFVVTAKNPAGPWSDPSWLHFEGIDPSIFFDDDGRAWVVNNGAPDEPARYNGHRAIWIQEFDTGSRQMVGPRKVLVNGGVDISKKPVWIEGPHLYKRDGWYYLCCAEGGTSVNHSQVIFRSKQVDGPYQPWDKNPILTQRGLDGKVANAVTSTGHADLVIGPDKNWWSIFLGVRPYDGRFSPMGRETFLLPVTWTDDGWPRILEPGQRVPLSQAAPKVTPDSPSSVPLNGNFTWRDDFKSPTLSPLWIMLRTPRQTWWKLDASAGTLALSPQAEPLTGTGNPSFLGRRVQHDHFTATVALKAPTDAGVSAGLTVFQNERHHYFFALKHEDDSTVVYVEKVDGPAVTVLGSAKLPLGADTTLRFTADRATCSFEYATSPDQWSPLVQGADAKLLTTEAAGGFVGATVGLHARIDTPPATPKPAAAGNKLTYVIVHGAWAGGWEHKKLADALEADGNKVYRVTLTGQGDRSHLASPDVGLSLHIQDVVNFIEWENLHDVVLVGHSYGGMVVTGAADRVADRLKRVIYLDAFLPEDGESAYSSMGSNGSARRMPATNGFISLGDQTGKPVPHVVPQSEKTFTEPIKLEHQDQARRIPSTYILTVDHGKKPEDDMFYRYYQRAQSRGWKVEIMEGDHVVHINQPRETARLLEQAAE
jgi:alpha-N-arabinofuranosidase